jgi:hypothetical protein
VDTLIVEEVVGRHIADEPILYSIFWHGEGTDNKWNTMVVRNLRDVSKLLQVGRNTSFHELRIRFSDDAMTSPKPRRATSLWK